MKKFFASHSWTITLVLSVVVIALTFVFQSKLSEFRRLGPLGIFFINFFASATLFVPAPAIATVIAGGALYSPWLVGIAAALGSVAGDMLGFLIGFSGKRTFLRKHGKKYGTLINLFKEYGDIAVFGFAFVPNPIFDAIGITAGALNYPPRRFFTLTLMGRLLRDFLLAYFGATFIMQHSL